MPVNIAPVIFIFLNCDVLGEFKIQYAFSLILYLNKNKLLQKLSLFAHILL